MYNRRGSLISSLQSSHNFGKQVLSIFLAKIMTTIFDFKGSRRLGKERNLYQGVSNSKKKKKKKGEGWGGGVNILPFLTPTPHPPPNQIKSKSNMAA